jgi:spore coat polysaccharide biosynthesis predicted glycosyltransferase SpsG
LIHQGEEVIFIGTVSGLNWIENRIRELGFALIYDSPNLFFPDEKTDVLILDSYSIDKNDPFLTKSSWNKIIAIVDSVTPDYRCDLRVHPGLDSSWNHDTAIPLLSGTSFIPLRKTINPNQKKVRSASRPLEIIVSSGGTDAFGLVNTLAGVLGETNAQFTAYLFTNSRLSNKLDSRFVYVPIGPEIDIISQNADLVFTTASTSSLEFIARGLPVGIISVVDNQEIYYLKLGELGVAAQVGRRLEESWALDVNLIKDLVHSVERRLKLSDAAANLIDSHGASRIVEHIRNF